MPKSRSPRVSIFMVSSRDRSHSQRRDSVVSTIARTPPPAFLFPIQRCQRPDRLSPDPTVFRRWVGGGGYLVTGLFRVNRPFDGFCGAPGIPGIWPQKPPRAAEGLPSPVRSDSIEARENTHLREKIKGLSTGFIFVSRERPRPERRRLSSGRLAARQPASFENFRQAPEHPDTDENRPP